MLSLSAKQRVKVFIIYAQCVHLFKPGIWLNLWQARGKQGCTCLGWSVMIWLNLWQARGKQGCTCLGWSVMIEV
jgi:hypothetical protein